MADNPSQQLLDMWKRQVEEGTQAWLRMMGQGTATVLEASGVMVHRVERQDEVAETVAAAIELAFQSTRAVAVLLGQRLIGTKRFE